MFALFSKDFRVFFQSPLIYIILGFCTIFWGYNYNFYLFNFLESIQSSLNPQEGGDLHSLVFVRHIIVTHILIVFTVPALTMKSFAEEKKMKTYDLLMTSPITPLSIVFSKFLISFLFIMIFLLLSSVYILWLGFFHVDIQWALVFSGYLALILLSSVYISIGLFCSSLTDSPLFSLILSFLLIFIFMTLGQYAEKTDSHLVYKLFEHLSFSHHISNFILGDIHIKGFVFFSSVVCLFLFLCYQVVNLSRWR